MLIKEKQYLVDRWNSGEGEKIYNLILKYINHGDDLWDHIHELFDKLEYSDELPVRIRKNGKTWKYYDFRGIHLNSKDLNNGYFVEALFAYADLADCEITDLMILGCEFNDTNLSGIRGSNVTFSGVYFDHSDLSNIQLKDSSLQIKLNDVNLKNAQFNSCNITFFQKSNRINMQDALFDNVFFIINRYLDKDNVDKEESWLDFNGARFTDKCKLYLRGTWNSLNFDNVEMIGLDLHKESGETDDPFKNCSSFKNANLSKANFTGLDLTSANFEGANLEGTNFTNAILENANFTGANLKDTIFTDAKTEGAIGLD